MNSPSLVKLWKAFILLFVIVLSHTSIIAQENGEGGQNLLLKVFFGHRGLNKIKRTIEFKSSISGMTISDLRGSALESDDHLVDEIVLNSGGGDIDELMVKITWNKPVAELLKMGPMNMWPFLMSHGSPGQIARLSQDPWNIPDAPILTVQLDKSGIEGFSFSLEQLRNYGAMWLPEQDVYLTRADHPIDFEVHLASLSGIRTTERVRKEPDVSFELFKSLWKDFGNPNEYQVPWQTTYMGTQGHLTVVAGTYGSIYKYAIDRWGNIRPDFGSPHRFSLDLNWEGSQWISQETENGLPILLTRLEKDGHILEMEQFASPLGNTNESLPGDRPGVFMMKLRFSGRSGGLDFQVDLNKELDNQELDLKASGDLWLLTEKLTGAILLMINPGSDWKVGLDQASFDAKRQNHTLTISGQIKEGHPQEVLLKFPSPPGDGLDSKELEKLDFISAKNRVLKYWNDWLYQGAQFQVPEESVNKLFRANLWHALILPRHSTGSDGEIHMDLPYSNIAYSQKNSDWPINQGVYVDYMIYGLRGYDEVAHNEIMSMFRTQQQPDGRIGGFADWGVYSPGHLYTIAQNYLLSGNRNHFEQLLPYSLKTLEWCIAQIEGSNSEDNASGLILDPLNDLTAGERAWAFTQGYYVAGLELFAKALSIYNHPLATEVAKISAKMKKNVVIAFSRASVKSPVVQLADGTWINYVPTDALTPRRMLDEWYPTDVDTGPLHLARLGVFKPDCWLTTAMLNDHEDNLYLQNKGAANEPVYVPQATAYLLRDEPEAVIRSFYSLMACGFSNGQMTALEHRWAHPQYYSPPSTDGAWFEIYRKMLINEMGSDILIIGQAIPRKWLESSKQIKVTNAPTYFGKVSFSMEGESSKNEIVATVALTPGNPPKELWIRFRHPSKKMIRSVSVNGQPWKNFNEQKEIIIIPQPDQEDYLISVHY